MAAGVKSGKRRLGKAKARKAKARASNGSGRAVQPMVEEARRSTLAASCPRYQLGGATQFRGPAGVGLKTGKKPVDGRRAD